MNNPPVSLESHRQSAQSRPDATIT